MALLLEYPKQFCDLVGSFGSVQLVEEFVGTIRQGDAPSSLEDWLGKGRGGGMG